MLEQGIADRFHLGAQLFVWRAGEVLLDAGLGLAGPNAPMTTGSMTLWRSAGKPLTAVAVARLQQRGLLAFDDPVAAHIPAFASHGKGNITVRHILTHTAGLAGLVGGARSWDERIDRICNARPQRGWTPGERAGYDPYAGWFILGELVRRLDGRPIDRFLGEAMLEPTGLAGVRLGIAPLEREKLGSRVAEMYKRSDGGRLERADYLNDDAAVSEVDPGANVRGPASGLGRFYAAMLEACSGGGGAGALLEPEAALNMVDRHRVGMHDRTFGATIDWGLGFMLNSRHHAGDHPYDFGPHASPEAFGHGGRQCACGFADPACQLAVAWVVNGMPGEPRHQQRNRAINTAVYEDLGLARQVA